jgi:histidinol-phosphatase
MDYTAVHLKPFAARMIDFMSRFGAIRSPGGALSVAMLAAGELDVWFEGRAEIWDLAALQVIIEEAGGRYFALDGSRRIDVGNAVACTPALEREVRSSA